MMCTLEDRIPPGKHSDNLWIPLFSSWTKPVIVCVFIPSFLPPQQSSLPFTPLPRPTSAGRRRDLRFSPLLSADASPRRRILNVSRSVWKQANVASDLWEKLTARCVDRHRSDALLRSGSRTQTGLRHFHWMGIRTQIPAFILRAAPVLHLSKLLSKPIFFPIIQKNIRVDTLNGDIFPSFKQRVFEEELIIKKAFFPLLLQS